MAGREPPADLFARRQPDGGRVRGASSRRSRAPRRRARFASGMARDQRGRARHLSAGERMRLRAPLLSGRLPAVHDLLPRFDIEVEFVDGRDAEAVERRAARGQGCSISKARPAWCSRPRTWPGSRPPASAQGAITIADNSWATPIFQRPIEHGVDLVLHSASKYLGGHSDTVAGVVCGPARADRADRRPASFRCSAASSSPFEAWLLVRGLRTLPLRMRRHHESGLEIAGRLAGASLGVVRVNHPACSATAARASPRSRAHPGCSASSSSGDKAACAASATR